MIKNLQLSHKWVVLWLFLAAAALSVAAYPEMFLTFKNSFILWYDYIEEYFLTFILTNFFYHGGVQLWNHYGQMPLDYSYVTFGLFKFQNVMTALVFYVLAPFAEHTGQLFHHVFAWANLMSHLFLRVAGIFLLLQCVTNNRWIVFGGAVVLAVFFSQPAFLWGTYMMSFFPLLMYFTVRFVQEFRWRYLLGLFMMYVIAVGNGLIYVGAMHLGMHFFILSCVIWAACFNRHGWRAFMAGWRAATVRKHWILIAGVMITAAMIIGPYLYILSQGLHDVAFGASESRISQPFDLIFYFNKLGLTLADSKNFIAHALNFIEYGNPVVFFGGTIFLLALIGVVFSRNTLKWAFALGILFLWLVNHPRQEFSLGLIAHWINALTNPLKTIPRSYAVVTYTMLSYLLMPLAALGIEALVGIFADKNRSAARWALVVSFMLFFVVTGTLALPSIVRTQLLVSALLVTGAVAWVVIRPTLRARRFLIFVLAAMTFIDIGLVVHQSKKRFIDECILKPGVFDSIAAQGIVEYDTQNPMIFPWREYAMADFSYLDEPMLWSFRGLTSNYYHVTNHALNFQFINGHSPRHVSYASWAKDDYSVMRMYLGKNKRMLAYAHQSVADAPNVFESINVMGLARDVAVVNDPSGRLGLSSRLPPDVQKAEDEKVYFKEVDGRVNDWVHGFMYDLSGDLMLLTFQLPADFPAHLATTWFTEDRKYLRFLAQHPKKGWMEFTPSQGGLIKPYTFDVQNIKAGRVTASFPKNEFFAGEKFRFLYAADKSEGVLKLWRGEYDNVGLDYRAPGDGWCILHYPYDPKWRLTIDGRPAAYYRTNKSFVGFPIKSGDHRILVQYWPQTFLRTALLLSAIATTLGLLVLIFTALVWERKRAKSIDD